MTEKVCKKQKPRARGNPEIISKINGNLRQYGRPLTRLWSADHSSTLLVGV